MLVKEQVFGFRQGEPNAGFVRKLWLLRASDVLMVGLPGILVKDDAVVTRLSLPSRTATFDEPMTTDRNGVVYTPTLEVVIPGNPADLIDFLFCNQASRWIAFWEDNNGQGWISGEPENGLRITNTKQSQAELRAFRLTLTSKYLHPTYRLNCTNLADLFPDAAFDYSFDLSFDS